MFSLRTLFTVSLITFFVFGGIFSFFINSAHQDIFYSALVRERVVILESIGKSIFGTNGYVNPNVASPFPKEEVRSLLESAVESVQTEGADLPKSRLWLINLTNNQILVSNFPEEDGQQVLRLPEFSDETYGVTALEVGPSANRVLEVTVRGGALYGLAMLVPKSNMLALDNNTGSHILFIIYGLVATCGLVLYLLFRFLIKNPLRELRLRIERLSKGDFSVAFKGEQHGKLDGTLNSFNAMVDSISSVRERDEVVSSMKSDFITTAAHQLRTPLSAVKWAIKIILDQDFGPLNVDQRTILMKGYESNDRMIRLVNDLLNVDRIDSGRLQYDFAPIDIGNLIRSVMLVVSPKAMERKVTISVPQEGQKYPPVKADTEKLRQVVQNLMDNAVKYSYPGGKVSVEVSVLEAEGAVKVAVSDSGIGIPKAQQEKIFGKFFRAENARKIQADGSGLGLYIMRQIILKHGGTVSFASEEGKGSTFTFSIPIYKADAPVEEKKNTV